MSRRTLLLAAAAAVAGCGDPAPDSALGPDAGRSTAGEPAGPIITLSSNILGTWGSGEPADPREVFAGSGLRFTWSAVPGGSGAPVAGYSYAVDDTSSWSPFGSDVTSFPPEQDPPAYWFPEAGVHTFWVRAVDEAENLTTLRADFLVYLGPLFCPPDQRHVLVVLDTDPAPLVANGIWPADWDVTERALVEGWFDGVSYQLWQTGGTEAPPVSLLNCASSTFWFLGSDAGGGATSVLESYHLEGANALQSYSASGGNVFLAGIRPSEALRWFQSVDDGSRSRQDYPVDFAETLEDPAWAPHWATTRLPLAEVERSVGANRTDQAELPRIRTARSAIVGGDNPYPDLPWDPARWSGATRGFGYFDHDVHPEAGEVIYELNGTGASLGVRRLVAPGVLGNAIYVGFHPYFVDDGAFRELVRAALADFGEPTEPGR